MKYTECIRMLIDSFSHFLGRLERVLSLGFTFSSGPSIITQRRNMEFLAIFILNLGSEWNPTRGYREMCDQIQNVRMGERYRRPGLTCLMRRFSCFPHHPFNFSGQPSFQISCSV